MSYQVIARKWRPQTFEEVTGQEIITQTLRNALEFDRLHHAYLFSGARGVGKTTTARILAKSLNCHKTAKPNLTPCMITDPTACPSCIEISESRSMDVLEIDAASHTGIGEVRETILDNINFNPARDRYRVFIIDEVHQLSKPAFNALLKTIEEPPPNVVFIMATTELHKVPETILSRCQEFEFRTIPLQKIFDRLKFIANAEKIDITDDALRELARSGEGSMRDAQSNFDQVISFSGESITPADVTNALGFAGVELLSKSISAIADRDKQAMLAVVDDIISRGHDLRNFCRDLLGLFRDLLVYKLAAEEKHLFESAVFSDEQMGSMAGAFADADLLRFFNSLCETESKLREAAHPRYVLEIGLIKLIEMRSVASIESILERLDTLAGRSMPQAAPPALSSAAATGTAETPEKKTLKVDAPHVDPAYEPPDEYIGAAESMPSLPVIETHGSRYSDPLPVRLPPLSEEELEHVEDRRLDENYEEKLVLNGDDLSPLKDVDNIVALLLGKKHLQQAPSIHTANLNGTAAAPAKDVIDDAAPDTSSPDAVAAELPELGVAPSPEELHEYARAHPAVRSAIRVFRAKIVEVERR